MTALPVAGAPPTMMPPQMIPPRRPCESVTLDVTELRPSVTLLVDQSGSMRQGYPDRSSEQSRWSVVREALLAPKTGVVDSLQQSLQLGLVFYTSHNGFSGGQCPMLSQVSTAINNYAPISALYDQSYPDDDTPTGAAVQEVVRQIGEAKRKGPEVLLLVTDGDPDTCQVPDPQTESGQQEALAAVSNAHAAGIDFYVLGVSGDISAEKLQQLANAGQGKRVDAVWGSDPDAAQPFRAGDNVADLTAQLHSILLRVPLCEVELEREVGLDELTRSDVVLDGQRLTFGSVDGYALKDPRHLQITGKACDTLRRVGKRLSVRISCN
jgi:hypothetical protein